MEFNPIITFLKFMAIAFITEATAEYLFKWIWDKLTDRDKNFPNETFRYIPMAVGIFLAFNYNLDLIKTYLEFEARWLGVGVVLTGIAIGRGSNFIHDLWNAYIKPIFNE